MTHISGYQTFDSSNMSETTTRTNNINIENLMCRICLTREEPFFPIFAANDTRECNDSNLYEKIRFIGKIELAENDGLPSIICERCNSLVNMVHRFCELSQVSDVRLREYYNIPARTFAKVYFDAFSQTENYATCEIGVQATEKTFLESRKGRETSQGLLDNLSVETVVSDENKMSTAYDEQNTSITNSVIKNEQRSQRGVQRRSKFVDNSCKNCKQLLNKGDRSKHVCLFFCKFCSAKFRRESTVQRHQIQCMQKVENSIAIETGLETNMLDGFNAEDVNRFGEEFRNLYKCKECTIVCSNKHTSKKHSVGQRRKKYICCNSDSKFYKADNLRRHREETGHNRFEERRQTSPFVETQGYKCETCQKIYSTKTALERHMAVHTDGVPIKCEYCVKTFLRIDTLKAHTMRHEEAKFYYCNKCTKKYVTRYQLDLHGKKHEKSRDREDENFHRFLCHICSKTCKSQASLSYHMSTHTGHKPYVCKICGRGFTISSNLVNHERTHTGFKPFVCHFCSAQFATSSSFKCHLTTHTGEANYHCDTCGKSFKRLKYLKEHRFTHTGEKPFACKVCGASYSHSGSLFAHTKKCKLQYPELYETQNCASQVQISVETHDDTYAVDERIT